MQREVSFTREETNFVPIELSDLFYHLTLRRPQNGIWVSITWVLDEHAQRSVLLKYGKEEINIPVPIHHKEDPVAYLQALHGDVNTLALMDVKRTIAFNLTAYHKQLISDFWAR